MISPHPLKFFLKTLVLSGPSVKDSEVHFFPGLNVVAGPSDTGKTYIAQCIDFMLGASSPPKKIPEAEGYDTASIQLVTEAGEELYLERSLNGGAFFLKRKSQNIILGEKHAADNDNTISHLLLTLTGLTGKSVRTNARGTTRSLSFRDIAHLFVVDEESVIAEQSPILSGQYTSKTSEKAVFRLLLTGLDDSSIVERLEPKIAKSKQEGKKELLKELLEKNNQEIDNLGSENITPKDLAGALEQADQIAAALKSSLSIERASASALEEHRKTVWQALRKTESRAAVITELQRRFELLEEQYASDLRRLEAVAEAGVRLAQVTQERCPVCGAFAEHQNQEHGKADASPEAVAAACNAEGEKIQLLVRDLLVTIASNNEELNQLNEQVETYRYRLTEVQTKLREEMEPRIAELVARIQASDEQRSHLARLKNLYQQREELSELLEKAGKPMPRANKLPSVSIGTDEAEEFSKIVEDLLKTWNFPNLDRVAFSEDTQDIVISGRKRSSHGKGIRALTHAAFTLGLLQYCRRKGRPHPGLVIIDSPLVVYREPESSDGVDVYDVKDAFYREVALNFSADQIIILENEDPPKDLTGANVIAFTGADHGRFGFLPRLPRSGNLST